MARIWSTVKLTCKHKSSLINQKYYVTTGCFRWRFRDITVHLQTKSLQTFLCLYALRFRRNVSKRVILANQHWFCGNHGMKLGVFWNRREWVNTLAGFILRKLGPRICRQIRVLDSTESILTNQMAVNFPRFRVLISTKLSEKACRCTVMERIRTCLKRRCQDQRYSRTILLDFSRVTAVYKYINDNSLVLVVCTLPTFSILSVNSEKTSSK